ncbi:SAF domain-containing protein [Nakamurella sp.]|uniref:SAF domain-containing protein n=1 Tax=Nakamurella sp. TaxID=1869182 RepID=UPI003B3B7BC8
MTLPPAPVPRRLSRPRWINVRVVGGILLVIAAVLIGARVMAAGSQTAPVWAAERDLAAGTVLGAGDLAAVEVNLGAHAGAYLTPGAGSPEGLTLVAPLAAGELLAASAVGPAGSGRVIAIPVAPENMPPGVGHGSTIDLYLTTEAVPGSGQPAATELVGRDLTVQSVAAPAAGGLSGATSNRYQLSVLLPADVADRLVRVLPTGQAVVVLISG